MAAKQRALQQLLVLVEKYDRCSVEADLEHKVFELDLAAALECSRAKLAIPSPGPTNDFRHAFTPGTHLRYVRERPADYILSKPECDMTPEELRFQVVLTPTTDWLRWLKAASAQLGRGQAQPGATPKRSSRANTIERLVELLKEHLVCARDNARFSHDETGVPVLLPRPTLESLAIAVGVSKSTVSRCIRDSHARHLKLLYDTADDVNAVLRWVAPR